jgi:hypothetical protein
MIAAKAMMRKAIIIAKSLFDVLSYLILSFMRAYIMFGISQIPFLVLAALKINLVILYLYK